MFFAENPQLREAEVLLEGTQFVVLSVCIASRWRFSALQIYKLFFIPPNFLLFLFEIIVYLE